MELKVEKRSSFGKQVKALRRNNKIPGIVYSHFLKENIPVSFDRIEFIKLYEQAWESTAINLKWDSKELVLIYNVDVHPVTNDLLHVDFLAIKADQKVQAEVSITLVGESVLSRKWEWNVELVKNTVLVEALPADLPWHMEIDISKIESLSDVIFVSDLDFWDKVEIKDDLEQAVVTAVAIRDEVEEEPKEEALEWEEAQAEWESEGEESKENSEEEKSE